MTEEKITWKWDNESNWDPFTLLGKIEIFGLDNSSIIDECTTIDSWVEPLFNGLTSLKQNKSCKFDLVVEPDDLVFNSTPKTNTIHYGQQKVIVCNIDILLQELKKICLDVLKDIKNKNSCIDQEAFNILTSISKNI